MKNLPSSIFASVWLASIEAYQNPLSVVRRLERGDADSSGSTLRTVGIVALVIVVVGVIGAAVAAAARLVSSKIGTGFTF